MEAVAVSAAVMQFIDSAYCLIAQHIVANPLATSLAIHHEELKHIKKSLSRSNNHIQQALASQQQQQRLTDNERGLQRIAADCQEAAGELIEALAVLITKSPNTRWRSFRHALQDIWDEAEVESLESSIDRFRRQMTLNILDYLRRQAECLFRDQSLVQESTEEIEQLLRNSLSVGDRFISETACGEKWRRDLIETIHQHGQGGTERMTNPTQIKDATGKVSDAVMAQERRVRERILHKLVFKSMNDREKRIPKEHEGTFEWIFGDPKSETESWSSFKGFLENQHQKIYWITGTPGSGKSTLMKYIRRHPQTTSLLTSWSGSHQLVQVAFYFWNGGLRIQMSVEGLLRALLHHCLRQLPSTVIQNVLTGRWETATLFDVDDSPWSLEELSKALKRLVSECCPDQKFFVMIDSLDECSGNQTQLMELIEGIVENTENLKLCVASRPWKSFKLAFKDRPSLRLHDLSADDIKLFVRSKLTANDAFSKLQMGDPLGAQKLLETLCKKAGGVFLWTYLVVQYLLEGVTKGSGVPGLQDQLEKFPTNLEDLYTMTLENLRKEDLDQASRLFQIVKACDESPTLQRVGLADLEEADLAISSPLRPISYKSQTSLRRWMRRKLRDQCRSLLDISLPITRFPGDDEPALNITINSSSDKPNVIQGDDEDIYFPVANLEIQYIHRTIRDNIQSPGVWSMLVSVHETPFDPHLALFKAHILELKSLSPASLSAKNMGFHIWMAIKYAKRSLNACSREEQVQEVMLLLDRLDDIATLLAKSSTTPAATFAGRCGTLQDGHWSSAFILHIPGSSFLHVMAICGVHQYLEMRLKECDSQKDNNNNNEMPLMIAALEGCLIIPEIYGYEDLFGPHLGVFKALLRNGYDCHESYNGCSAWDLAMNAGYAQLLELFKQHTDKPVSLPSPHNSNKTPTRGEYWVRQGNDHESNTSRNGVAGYWLGSEFGSE
ncbi:putative P-loop containing nucleoside triphosphate hydrolase [Rosellinia necatrix]|uniref:Putative P-loop containing nucleoside triphosphate hydrolase n=1 Tax=Rosellinia necatrix TaxID=77044 RepID=A0A1W2TNE3_ROSNE|nr:putative P-loop containing nucleoside triphosphate hydrolase [Rosellinia necatrix]